MRRKPLVIALLASLSLGVAGCNDSNHSHNHTHEHADAAAGAVRVLVDNGAGALRLYNLQGREVGHFEIADVNALSTSEDGRFGIIRVRGEAPRFRFLDSGVWVEDHGDHVHLEVDPPELLTYSIDADQYGADRSAHVVSRDGRISLFFDGSDDADQAVAVTIPLSNLTASSPETPYLLTGNRHHGIAVPAAGGSVIMSVAEADEGGTARTGVRVYDQQGNEIAAFAHSCPGLHGYAVVGDHYLFGCAREGDGHVLALDYNANADQFTESHIAYLAEGARVSNFAFHADLDVAVAPWGADAMIRIDPEAGALSASDVLELGAAQCGYALRDDTGEQLLVLTIDGMLRAYNVSDWSEAASLQAMEPFACSGARPVLASVGSNVYLTRPATQDLAHIALGHERLAIHHTVDLGYTPIRMTLFRHPAGLSDYGDH